MAQTISSPPSLAANASSRPCVGALARSHRGRPSRGEDGASAPRAGVRARSGIDPLGRYTDATGRAREVITGRRGDGCVLVVDRDTLTLGDRRLVALLAGDEPTENAALVCAHYLRDAPRGRCRRVTAEDLTGRPFPVEEDGAGAEEVEEPQSLACETDLAGRRAGAYEDVFYRLELACTDSAARELRWCRRPRWGAPAAPMPVCLREAVGALERYEPVCGLTRLALARYRDDASVSTAVLRGELERLRESPIVLNRKLRQRVLIAIERHGLSLSEIAIRCGRVKRDANGNASGETSWLARRVGILPESGSSRPTPWVHSDVLALIARNGLGISPREVELG
jgi:hypothetical protein